MYMSLGSSVMSIVGLILVFWRLLCDVCFNEAFGMLVCYIYCFECNYLRTFI